MNKRKSTVFIVLILCITMVFSNLAYAGVDAASYTGSSQAAIPERTVSEDSSVTEYVAGTHISGGNILAQPEAGEDTFTQPETGGDSGNVQEENVNTDEAGGSGAGDPQEEAVDTEPAAEESGTAPEETIDTEPGENGDAADPEEGGEEAPAGDGSADEQEESGEEVPVEDGSAPEQEESGEETPAEDGGAADKAGTDDTAPAADDSADTTEETADTEPDKDKSRTAPEETIEKEKDGKSAKDVSEEESEKMLAEDSGNEVTVTTWAQLRSAASDSKNVGKTIVLAGDLKAKSDEELVVVSKTLTIDLNGHTLDRDRLSRTNWYSTGRVIEVKDSATLTIKDSSEGQTGVIRGGHAYYGAGITIAKGSTCIIEGGTIKENKAEDHGGGIRVQGTLIMTGGVITGNTADDDGGGIYNDGGTIRLNDAAIKDNRSDGNGGGIHVKGGALNMTGGEVSGNSAEDGGGVYNNDGTISLDGVTVSGNRSRDYGGAGINNKGAAEIRNTTIKNNTAKEAGGGVYTEKDMLFENCVIEENVSNENSGGGIFVDTGTVTFRDTVINYNTANNRGGGIDAGDKTAIHLYGGSVSHNIAKASGGGIFVNEATATAEGTEICHNLAYNNGGGINTDGAMSLTDCVVESNTSDNKGGGIYARAALTIAGETTVRDNESQIGTGGGIYIENALNVYGKPDINDNTDSKGTSNVYLEKGKLINLKEKLADGSSLGVILEKTAGTFTSGYKTYYGDQDPVLIGLFSADNRGASVRLNASGEVEIIASLWADLQRQITNADNGTIIKLTGDYIAAAEDVRLEIPQDKNIAIDLNGFVLDRNKQELEKNGGQVILVRGTLTIRDSAGGGRITGGYASSGGAISNMGTLYIEGGEISGNKADYYGGAIECSGGSALYITGGKISGNYSGRTGGALQIGGGDAIAEISGGEISSNTAERYGGAIHISSGTLTITGGEISGNTVKLSTGGGGAIYINGNAITGTLNLYGGKITGNDAPGEGGGILIAAEGSFLNVKGAPVVSGNSAGNGLNIVLKSGRTINIEEKLSGSAKLDVTVEKDDAAITSGFKSSGSSIDNFSYNGNGNGRLEVRNNELYLKKTQADVWVSSWEELRKAASSSANKNKVIALSKDITAGSEEELINATQTLTIDLNGHTLNRNRLERTNWYSTGRVIEVKDSATLTIKDSIGTGIITGGHANYGAGIIIRKGSTCIIESGTIRDNKGEKDGGGIWSEGTLIMTGGVVTANTAEDGGGIFNNGGTITINDAVVSNNKTTKHGGGGINNKGSGEIKNTVIKGNTSKESGAGIYSSGKLTLENCVVEGNVSTSGDRGGGICNEDKALVLIDTIVRGNKADGAGGGIYNEEGTVTMTRGEVTGNTSSDGGGVYNEDGTIRLEEVLVSGNRATEHGAGGINNKGKAEIRRSTIKNNRSKGAGGGIWAAGSTTLDQCTVEENTSEASGGGITSAEATVTLTNTVVKNNIAKAHGGGIFNNEGTLKMTGGEVTGNMASGEGGGIYNSKTPGKSDLEGVNITGNASGSHGGGIYIGDSRAIMRPNNPGEMFVTFRSEVKINGGTVSGNTSYAGHGGGICAFGKLTLSGSVNVTDNQCGLEGGGIFCGSLEKYEGWPEIFISGKPVVQNNTAASRTNNVFLQDYQGMYFIRRYAEGVPVTIAGALDAGASVGVLLEKKTGSFTEYYFKYNPETAPSLCFTADMNGYSVKADGNGDAMIAPSRWQQLQDQINLAESGSTITLDGNYTAAGVDVALVIPEGKEITIDLAGYSLNRNLKRQADKGQAIVVNGTLTVKDSSENRTGTISGGYAMNGGGIFVSSGASCRIEGGRINGNNAKNGGGILNEGTLEITGGEISENNSDQVGGGIVNNGSFTMTGGVVKDNTTKINGGGIESMGRTSIRNAEITGNTAHGSGGALSIRKGSVCDIYETVMTGNTAEDTARGGGAIYLQSGGGLELWNVSITGNNAIGSGGGVLFANGAALQVQGAVKVTGNAAASGRNIMLEDDCAIMIMRKLPDSAMLDVALKDAKDPITISFGASGSSINNFSYNETGNGQLEVRGGELYLKEVTADVWVSSWEQLRSAASSPANKNKVIALSKDLKAASDENLINALQTLTIDLNGHTLDRDRLGRSDWYSTGRVIEVKDGATLTIKDSLGTGIITGGHAYYGAGIIIRNGSTCIIEGGTVKGNKGEKGGGGIFVDKGTLVMTGGAVIGNTADDGGGIYNDGGTIELDGVIVSGNISQEYGGAGINNKGAATIKNTTIANNAAKKNGGGIYASKGITLENCVIEKNRSSASGGGIYGDGTSVTLTDTIVKDNTASAEGGGISSYKGTLVIAKNETGCEISDNTGKDAGGVYSDGNLTIDGALIRGNSSTEYGGAGVNTRGKAQIKNTEIRENTAVKSGAGVYSKAEARLENCVIEDNKSTAEDGGGIHISSGSMTLSGTQIKGNEAARIGGGVFVDEGSLKLSDGEITGNKAVKGGGVYGGASMNGIQIEGTPVIRKNLGGNDLYLTSKKVITITGPLEEGADIGVAMSDYFGVFTSGYSAKNPDKDPAEYFTSNDGYRVFQNDKGEAELKADADDGVYFIDKASQIQTDTYNLNSTNWMSGISGERYLHEINLPASHDSSMKNVQKIKFTDWTSLLSSGFWVGLGVVLAFGPTPILFEAGVLTMILTPGMAARYAQTQDLYIDEQMESGIRKFDIRMNNLYKKKHWYGYTWSDDGKNLWMSHGQVELAGNYTALDRNDDRISLYTVLNWATDFLTRHPSETIILDLRAETLDKDHLPTIWSRARNILREYSTTINPSTGEPILYKEEGSDSYLDRYTQMPKLKDCRGKIVVRTQNPDMLGGYDTPADFGITSTAGMNHTLNVEEKIDEAYQFYEKLGVYDLPKNADEHLDVYYGPALNCTGQSHAIDYVLDQDPAVNLARRVNDALFGDGKLFSLEKTGTYLGFVQMDAAKQKYADIVWKTNFFDGLEYRTVTVVSGLDESVFPTTSYTLLKGTEIPIPDCIYEINQEAAGKYFQGWEATTDEGAPIYWIGDTYKLNNDVTFTAVWGDEPKTPVKIVWKDGDNYDNLRPDSLKLSLTGNTAKEITVSAAEDWNSVITGELRGISVAWEKAGRDAAGKYKAEVSGKQGNGYVITLTHTPQVKTNISGVITWNDNNNAEGKRPARVTLHLYRGDQELHSAIVYASAGWAWSFGSLPEYVNGEKVNYTLIEDEIEYYSIKISDYEITNNYMPPTVLISGGVIWVDDDNAENTRPESVTVRLFVNDEEFDAQTVRPNVNGEWNFEFEVPMDPQSEEEMPVCTLKEDPIEGYEEPRFYNYDEVCWIENVKAGHECTPSEPFRANEVEPTCETDGSYEEIVICSVCGKVLSRKTVTLDATGHNWREPVYTWSEDNSSVTAEHVCKNDESHVETETVETTSRISKEAGCVEKGETTYTAVFENKAFETQTRTVENIEPAGHVPDDSKFAEKNVVPATCTETGSYDRVTVCKICGAELASTKVTTPATGHAWNAWETTKPATCEGEGEETRTCKNDPSHKETRTVAATGHKWGEWKVTREATETKEGEETRVCENDPSHKETRAIPLAAHVHHVTKVAMKAAACTEAGNIEYYVCDQGEKPCGKYFVKDEQGAVRISCDGTEIPAKETEPEKTIIPAAGHKWNDGVITTEPACITDGVKTYTCTACGETKEEVVEKTLHDNEWSEETITTAACEQSGYHWNVYSCKVCKEIMTKRLIKDPATGHDWGAWETEKAASCEEKGVEKRICKNDASHTETRTIEATGHDWAEPVYTWSADNSEVTAERICRHDASHTETETVRTKPETVKNATCEGMGETKYTAVFENEGFKTQTKTVEDIRPTGHTPAAEPKRENVKDPTCEAEGSYDRVTVCTVCGKELVRTKEIIAPLGHEFGDWETEKAPTCEAEGLESRTCKRDASHKETRAVSATGHKWGEWTVAKEATETETGIETRVCANDPSHREIRIIPVLAHVHQLTKVEEKAATCTEEGNIEYYVCNKGDHPCGRYFAEDAWSRSAIIYEETQISVKEIHAEDTIIPATDHSWDNGRVLVQPGCTTDGIMQYICTVCRAVKEEAIAMKGHGSEWITETITPATCEESGSHWNTERCPTCGEVLKSYLVKDEAIGHDWGEWTVTKEAACEEAGEETRTCQHDASHVETRAIRATGHDWNEWEITKEATCEADGEETRICRNDASHVETRAIKATGHDWNEWEITKEATCEADGEETRTCKNDPSHVETRAIKATGHDWDEPAYTWSKDNSEVTAERICKTDASHKETETVKTKAEVIKEADCENKGRTRYTAEFENEAFTTRTKTVEDIRALGHVPDNKFVIENVVEPTCTEPGSYDRVTVCKNCGTALIRMHEITMAKGHDFGAWEITKAAACEADGEETRTCKNDPSHKETRVLGATGHKWGEWTVTKEPTETETGTETRVCGNDPSHKETRIIPLAAHVHHLSRVEAKAATCKEEGNIEYYICDQGENNCGRYFAKDPEGAIRIVYDGEEISVKEINKEDTVIPIGNHSWDEGEITREPTCVKEGVRTSTCTVCGAKATEPVEKIAHEPKEETEDEVILEPSCEEPGYHWSISRCKFCGEILNKQRVEDKATGHDWGDWTTTKAATCEADGEETRTCKHDAAHVETRAIKAIGHDWGDWTTAKAATCEADGEETRTCKHDAAHVETRAIKAIGHDWGDWTTAKEATCEADGEETRTCKHDAAHVETRAIKATGHDWGDWTTVKAATCEADGEETRICKNDAAHTETRVIKATGHDWGDWTITKAATCEADGEETRTCRNDAAHAETRVIKATGHDWSEPVYTWSDDNTEVTAERICRNDPSHIETETVQVRARVTKKATCEGKGETTYTAAFENEDFLTQTKTLEDIPAIGHTPKTIPVIENVTEPTCEKEGSYDRVTVCLICGAELSRTKEISAPLGHRFSEWETTKEAGCETDGEETRVCMNDSSHKETRVVKATGHDWGEWKVTKEATESEAGEETRTCRNDPSHKETRGIPLAGHVHMLTRKAAKAAACTEAGNIEYYVCDQGDHKCGRYFAPDSEGTIKIITAEGEILVKEVTQEETIIPASGHKWDAGTVITEPSCNAEGLKKYTCAVCKETEEEAIEKIPHETVEETEVIGIPDCEEPGYHWNIRRCRLCGDIITSTLVKDEATGHDWAEPAYTWADDNSEVTAERICRNDDTHKETETVKTTSEVTGSATCEDKGETTYTAEFKNDAFSKQTKTVKDIDATGHDWGEWTVTKEATESEEGEETRTCRNDPSHKETRVIPVLSHVHQLTKVEAKAATCTEDGNIEYYVCDQGEHKCGRFFAEDAKGTIKINYNKAELSFREIDREETLIHAAGHKWDDGKVTTEPTCSAEGVKTYTCSVCGETKEEAIEKTAHDPEEVIEVISEATCEEPGYHWNITRCKVCKEVLSRERVKDEALGHAWGEWEEITPATGTSEGLERRTCTRCNETSERAIPKEAEYRYVGTDGLTWTKGSRTGLEFTFKRSIDDASTFSHFKGVKVDGSTVDASNYDAKSGSLILTLKPEYLERLSVGAHTLLAEFEDANNPAVQFTVKAANGGGEDGGNKPGTDTGGGGTRPGGSTAGGSSRSSTTTGAKTGDTSEPWIWIVAMLAAALTLNVSVISRRKRKNRKNG